MYVPEGPLLSTRVCASPALLQAGLERAASIAGLQPVEHGAPAAIVLRSSSDDANDTIVLPGDIAIDVTAGRDHVTVTIAFDPGPEVWAALRALVHELLGGDDRT